MATLSRSIQLMGLALLALVLPACQQTRPASPAAKPLPEVKYSVHHDAEIKAIMDLANKAQWEAARTQAEELLSKHPTNSTVQRINVWVKQQGQRAREQALEDKIREIDSKSSVFNPTLPGLLAEQKDRGLPASKDIRDTVQKIETSRVIPETYGKTKTEKGPLFDFEAARGPIAKILDKEVLIGIDNISLENLIVDLSKTSGINIVADKSLPALTNRLTVHMEKVKLGEFFKYVARNYQVQFQVGPELVWVSDATATNKLMEETRFYRLRKGFILPAQLDAEEATREITQAPNQPPVIKETQKFKKFVNDAAPAAPALERAITNLFTGSKWFIDYEHNLVVARGTREQLEVMEKIIEEFDRPVQQVLIEARFVTISKPAFLQLGAIWESGRSLPGVTSPQDFTGLVGNQNFPVADGGPALGIGLKESFTNILGRESLRATISALEQNGESQTISSPRLVAINNRPASISDGKVQYYYEEYEVRQNVQQYFTSSSWVPKGKPVKITGGAELNVLASIAGDGKHIVLALNPKVNTDVQVVTYSTLTEPSQVAGGTGGTFDIKLPQYRTQELQTRVVVKSGETIVMGGVLERERTTIVEAVPVLGNIPVIGAAFRRRTEVDRPRYLLIFVTATLLTETGEYLLFEDAEPKK